MPSGRRLPILLNAAALAAPNPRATRRRRRSREGGPEADRSPTDRRIYRRRARGPVRTMHSTVPGVSPWGRLRVRVALIASFAVVVVAIVVATTRPTAAAPGGGAGAVVARLAQSGPTSRDVRAYAGQGAWVDGFDFGPAYQQGGAPPPVSPSVVDDMAAHGVKTLFLQAVRNDPRSPGGRVVPADVRGRRHRLREPPGHRHLQRARAPLRRRRGRHRGRRDGNRRRRAQRPADRTVPAAAGRGRQRDDRCDRPAAGAHRGGEPAALAGLPLAPDRPALRRVAANELLDVSHGKVGLSRRLHVQRRE